MMGLVYSMAIVLHQDSFDGDAWYFPYDNLLNSSTLNYEALDNLKSCFSS